MSRKSEEKLKEFQPGDHLFNKKKALLITPVSKDTDMRYTLECIRDSVFRNEAPCVPGLMFHVFKKAGPVRVAMNSFYSWVNVTDVIAMYTDLGVSAGMERTLEIFRNHFPEIEIERRSIKK